MNMDKIELRDFYLYITPNRHEQSQGAVIISHGSGGISDINLKFAYIACANNYDVFIIDHFTKRNIKSQYWHDLNELCTFDNMAEDILKLISIEKEYDKILLSGISAGGTGAILTSSYATKTFAICPALAFMDPLYGAKNLTIIAGIKDDWCPINQARKYQKEVQCKLIELPCYHGFLNPREDRFLKDTISLREGHPKGVTVKYDKECAEKTYWLFEEWLF